MPIRPISVTFSSRFTHAQNKPTQISKIQYAWPQKKFATRANFFFSTLLSSPLICFYSTKQRVYSRTIDSLLIDWKLTFLSFPLHGSFVPQYADSSDQRDIFLHGHSICEYVQSNQSNTRHRKRTWSQEQTVSLQSFSLFLHASVSSLLNKKRMIEHKFPLSSGSFITSI